MEEYGEDLKYLGHTFGEALGSAARRYGTRVAARFDDRVMTFESWESEAIEVARSLLALGIRAGSKVAVMAPGTSHWASLEFGCGLVGAVLVPLNTRYKSTELFDVLERSHPDVLAVGDRVGAVELVSLVEPVLERLGTRRLAPKHLVDIGENSIAGSTGSRGWIDWDAFKARGRNVPGEVLAAAVGRVGADSPVIVQFTSGTTSTPRGAVLTQGQVLQASYCFSGRMGIGPSDVIYSPQPFYHCGGSVCTMLAPIVLGAEIVVPKVYDPFDALEKLERHACSAHMGMDTMYLMEMSDPSFPQRDLSSLTKGWSSGSPSTLREIASRMGIEHLCSCYGLTESSGTTTTSWWTDPDRLASNGRPFPGLEVRIAPAGESGSDQGEILIRGWSVMQEYLDDETATRQVIDSEGWLHTGDLGRMDPEGRLSLTGRLKDMIRVGGENVAAAEVEALLQQHPAVRQAAVFSVPDARLQEVVMAVVQLIPGASATEYELMRHCERLAANFKVPRFVRVVSDWPTTGSGKVRKFEIRQAYMKELKLEGL